jgi:2',3'-cyclic-nucleotide 2'-phosphodiesterase/3'-nucleotidase
MVVRNAMETRLGDNALIEFFNHVQMKAAGVDISNTALFDNDSPGLPENVTMRDVVSNYIYPNTLKVIRMTGQDMKEGLERSAAYFKTYEGGEVEVNPAFTKPKPQLYNYDMWEGIEYLFDIRKPYGERVVKLEYHGKPVEMEAEYDVVMNNYRSGGGGDYFMYKDKPVIKDIPVDVSELIANEIIEKKVIKATVDHNWKVIY